MSFAADCRTPVLSCVSSLSIRKRDSPVLITGFPAAAFGTNCYVVAPEAGAECVVVDPGIGVVEQLDEVLAEHRLQPVAVLLTHGHLDHTLSVTPVCGARGVPAYLHPEDNDMLRDPLLGISAETAALFGGRLDWTGAGG